MILVGLILEQTGSGQAVVTIRGGAVAKWPSQNHLFGIELVDADGPSPIIGACSSLLETA